MDSKFSKVEGVFTVFLRSKDNVNFVIKQIHYLRQYKMLKIKYRQNQIEFRRFRYLPRTFNHF